MVMGRPPDEEEPESRKMIIILCLLLLVVGGVAFFLLSIEYKNKQRIGKNIYSYNFNGKEKIK